MIRYNINLYHILSRSFLATPETPELLRTLAGGLWAHRQPMNLAKPIRSAFRRETKGDLAKAG